MFNTIKNLLFPPSNNSGTQDTTQDFVNIESIHENMIINKSGIAIMMIGLEAISRINDRKRTSNTGYKDNS